MGHLSNPIGFRLNFEKKWKANFFVKNIYYPELINTLIHMRDYIYYYLTRKRLLQSGLLFSHFNMLKFLKKYYFKIYIYHIDLEKGSYDYINKLYAAYYDSYNSLNYKFVKDRTEAQTRIYKIYKDLSNSDLFIYLYLYCQFYTVKNNNRNYSFLDKNIYMQNDNVIDYAKLITYVYYKQLLKFYICKKKLHYHYYNFGFAKEFNKKVKYLLKKLIYKTQRINNLMKKWFIKRWKNEQKKREKFIKLSKIKGLILYKAKKLIQTKPLLHLVIKKSNSLKKRFLEPVQQRLIKLAWQITKKTIMKKLKIKNSIRSYLNPEEQDYSEVLVKALKEFKYQNILWVGKYKKYRNLFPLSFGKDLQRKKYKKYKFFKSILDPKVYKQIAKAVNSVKRAKRNAVISSDFGYKYLHINNKYQIDVISLFVYLCRKTKFKKVRNGHDLWKKWMIIYKYISLFKMYNLLNSSQNVTNFLLYIKTAIWLSKKGLIWRKHYFSTKFAKRFYYFNIRNLVFSTLQSGIYRKFFYNIFILLNNLLKWILAMICNHSHLDKITNINTFHFAYFFISNHNVSAPFIARYIILKLKRGFTVTRTLKPLKRELIRVSKESKSLQKPFSNYLTHKFKGKTRLISWWKKIYGSYMQSCFTFFDFLFNSFSNENNIMMIPTYFTYYWNFRNKIQKSEFWYSRTWRRNITRLLCDYYHVKKFSKIHKSMYILIDDWRHNLWLFFLSIFRFYGNGSIKLYRFYSYRFKNRQTVLRKYKEIQRNNKILFAINQMDKANVNGVTALNATLYTNLNQVFSSVLNLFNNFIISYVKKKVNTSMLAFSSFFNTHFLNYSMLKTLWNVFNKVNLRNERDLYMPKYQSLIKGFKMVLKGRFSRKQRASKMTLLLGKVPLNTLNVKMEFSLEVTTVKNSAISLKLYMYRNSRIELFNRILKIE